MIAGSDHALLPLIRVAAAELPAATLHEVLGAGHLADLRRSDLVGPIVTRFLVSSSSAGQLSVTLVPWSAGSLVGWFTVR
jgi:hypothetical protein